MDARLLAVVAAVALSACASTGRNASLAGRFVRQGTPTVDLGGVPPPAPSRARASSRSYAIVDGVSRSGGMSSPLEASDRRLGAALLRVRLAPTADAHVAAAMELRRVGVPDQAFDHYTRSLILDSSHAAAYDGLARLWRDWGRIEEALADATRAAYYAPTSAAARNTLGTVLVASGQLAAAEAAFRDALALDPQASYAARNLCTMLMRSGRTLDAIPVCRHADALQERDR